MSPYRAIIFDLGNVVINFSFGNIFNYWAHVTGVPAQELKNNFDFDDMFCRFEKGEIRPSVFRSHVLEKLRVQMSDAQFDEGWNRIYVSAVPGIESVLQNLRQDYRLVALTNTNELHVKRWMTKYSSLLQSFEKIFCSNEIKARKPERKAFDIVLRYLRMNPHDVLFLDDNPEFVKAASDMAISSILVASCKQMIRELAELGIYSP
jgi:putative hydrolase of the HAD superfamily